MGACTFCTSKVILKDPDNKLKKTDCTNNTSGSQIRVASDNQPNVFNKCEMPTLQNTKIIQIFNKIKSSQHRLSCLTQSYTDCNWKEIQYPSLKIKELYGICKWRSFEDKIISGPGLICHPFKENQFLIGGQFQNGKVKKGTIGFKIFATGTYYIGEFDSQLTPHGEGFLQVEKNQYYRGAFFKGVPHGNGQKVYPDRTFRGEFKNGQIIKGKQITQKGSYQGTFKNNQKYGSGIIKIKKGISFEGQFEDGKKEGIGILKDINGVVIKSGVWKNDKYVGQSINQ